MATNINNRLVCNEPHANLDSYYGPYDSVHEAFVALADTTVNGVNYTKKYIGLTVGVWNSSHTEITEYWFKGGLAESNLVLKTAESGLPGGVKIVTFDKNGATSGSQNSILTDTNSQVVLPECTLAKTGSTFSKWSYNGTLKNPGDVITIGASTVVQATWGAIQYYTVSWTNGSNITITGTAGGTSISSGASVAQGTSIVLTATPHSGYTFKNWTGKPSGATENENTLTFTLNSNVSGISAVAEAVVQNYTVSWIDGDNTGITGKVGEDEIESGVTQIPAGSIVVLTAMPTLRNYKLKNWTGKPSGATENENTLTFTLNGNVSGISATSERAYRIAWTNGTNVTIDGAVGGNPIESGELEFEGTVVMLTAKVDDGYVFKNWINAPAGSSPAGNTLKVTMGTMDITGISAEAEAESQDYTVSWTEASENVTVRGTANGNQINSGDSVASGSTIVLTALPGTNYGLKNWTNAPDGATESGNTLTFTLSGNVSGIKANVEKQYTISWFLGSNAIITGTANGVAITSGATVLYDDAIELTATPNPGYKFASWRNAPNYATENGNKLNFRVQGNVSNVSATAYVAYEISWNKGEHVSIICMAGGEPVKSGDLVFKNSAVELTAIPALGYTFKNWTGVPSGLTVTDNPLQFTLTSAVTNIAAEVEI